MQTDKIIKGRIVFAAPGYLVLANGHQLFKSNDSGDSWHPLASLPVGLASRCLMANPIIARLLRQGVHHFAQDNDSSLIIANRDTYWLNSGKVRLLEPLHSSRPMALCSANNSFYYGEYCANATRRPVRIWRWRPGEPAWSSVWQFDGIRHVHGIFHDPYSDALWVTTGDNDRESAIWKTSDDFTTLKYIVGGSQQHRAVQLLFTKKHIYFGSDTPNERNHLYRMNRLNQSIETLGTVGGSIFYGCKAAGNLFFSTAVEPSQVNKHRFAELWWSAEGNQWRKLIEFRKDHWSMKYLLHGQILFPNGPGDNRYLFFSPFATRHHGHTFRVDISSIDPV